ncbi:MAG: DUF4124 domain-containing protein [Gammaproteobacteria bacterium]|nr:DUF4124 domain-containing protein [Gammaproteobacteria bacterium]
MKLKLTCSLALTLILTFVTTPAALAGKIYKWVDENGNVQYGAEKPDSGAQEIKVKTKPATVGSANEGETEPEAADTKDAQENPEGEKVKVTSQEQAAEIEKKNAEIREKNCSIAKRRAAGINQGGRLYEVDEKGERQYWDDNTRKAKLEESQAQIDEWCK